MHPSVTISRGMVEQGQYSYIAALNGTVVGHAVASIDGDKILLHAHKIDPTQSDMGVDRALINRIIAELGAGCTELRLQDDLGHTNRVYPLTGAKEALDIQALIFDMDGLLFDTERLYLQAWPVIGEAMGAHITPEMAKQVLGVCNVKSEAFFQAHFGPTFTIKKMFPLMEAWVEAYVLENGLPIKPGARELLQLLQEKGIPMALGTSNILYVAEAYLGEAGLTHYFTAMATGDMVGAAKPAPDVFLLAAEKLGLPPDKCLVLDDTPFGITAAHLAGCIPAMVPDHMQPDDETYRQLWRVFSSLEQVPLALF